MKEDLGASTGSREPNPQAVSALPGFDPERSVVLRRGGWFVIDEVRGWSGPWSSEEAAKLAARHEYGQAHIADRIGRK